MARRSSCSTLRPPAAKEKQRRDRMKDLFSTLASLLHLQPYERMSLPDFLDRATSSLVNWKERVEGLKVRKEELEKEVGSRSNRSNTMQQQQQVVRVMEMDFKLEANLIINNNNKKVEPYQILSVIEQGGAEITSSSFSTVGHQTYCTIHAKAFQARLGFDVALIESKLLELVC
ncbi:transcription factor bHLH168-like [Cynara cardunculus var. scolymus]|uniref:BHLH domain-containing protein n=1 Tax=Cynara cardunculus var. scolymus TaxID=59895 RepID=A0A124SG83_CYNCS|nr:transcription factor bHLH168-like [Cynara cardunculus var. scolymus]KVI05597.1 hypothetical protein Ccrd_016029 [Cynara cardunculus var. scolymus]